MVRVLIWQGDEDTTNALVNAITRNCTPPCTKDCTAHALLRDQHALDTLLFHRSIAQRLLREEFDLKPTTPRA